MNEAAHAVLLSGRHVGTLLQRGDVSRFVFSDSYWSDPDRPVLGLWFEDRPHESPSAALRLPQWFSNLLPEGLMREWIARARGVSAQRELQLLLHIGADLPGAVVIVPNSGDDRHLLQLDRNAHMPDLGASVNANLLKFSLAGVGMKFSMLRDGERLTLPAANGVGDWIVKMPDPSFPLVPQNEFGVMSLAREVGIDVPAIELVHRDALTILPDSLWPRGETMAYAIRRFDRAHDGTRIHIEDFAQIRGWYPDGKYDGSFASVVALAYRGTDRRSLRESIRRLTFNLLIGNGDAHLKNWSLIYLDTRVPALSPAYDLVSTGPYYGSSEPETLALKLGGTRAFDRVSRSAFTHLQTRLAVQDSDIIDVVDETSERFFSAWNEESRSRLPPSVDSWIDSHSQVMRRLLTRPT